MASVVTQHRSQIYLDDFSYQFVKILARQKNISIAQVIRDAISHYTTNSKKGRQKDFDKAKKSLLKLAGLGKGPSDLAEKHDAYW